MSFEALAEDVEVRDRRSSALEQPVLVGHSMGGMVVQTMLRRAPDDYRAAVLSCTSPAFGNPAGDFQKKFVADRLAPLDAGKTMADIAPRRGRRHHGRRMPTRPGARCSSRATRRCRRRPIAPPCNASSPSTSARNLPNIKVPVLCLAAEHDRNAPPPVVEKMASKIPGALLLLHRRASATCRTSKRRPRSMPRSSASSTMRSPAKP